MTNCLLRTFCSRSDYLWGIKSGKCSLSGLNSSPCCYLRMERFHVSRFKPNRVCGNTLLNSSQPDDGEIVQFKQLSLMKIYSSRGPAYNCHLIKLAQSITRPKRRPRFPYFHIGCWWTPLHAIIRSTVSARHFFFHRSRLESGWLRAFQSCW